MDLIKKRYPNASVTWVAEKGMAPILKNHPNIDQLLLVDTKGWRKRMVTGAMWKELFGFLRYLRDQNFDVALDFQGLFKSAVLARITGAERRIGMSQDDRKESWSGFLLNEFCGATPSKKHIIEKNLALLEPIDIAAGNEPWNFHIHPEPAALDTVENELQKLELERFVLVSPGGGWVTKRWEPDKFALLIDSIYNDLNIPALIVWGPGEKQLADKIARKCISPAMVSFSTDLAELVALISRSRLMIGGDSGPLHLASALGIPVVGIFGPTDPARNGPWNPHDSACTVRYECSPCYQRTCPIGVQCLKKLEVGTVLDSVKSTYYITDSLLQSQ